MTPATMKQIQLALHQRRCMLLHELSLYDGMPEAAKSAQGELDRLHAALGEVERMEVAK